jgi:uncharacterized protein involved in exopolysaccharide biosynthesis
MREGETAEPHGGGGGTSPAASAQAPADLSTLVALVPKEQRDPALEAQIGNAVAKYADLRAQISSARVELDLAQAAFRYRYTVVVPAEPPPGPIKPKAGLIIAAATLASLLIGIIVAIIAELRMDRVAHRWQVERHLGLPVLAELRLPQTTRKDPSA